MTSFLEWLGAIIILYLDIGFCYAALFLVLGILGEVRSQDALRYALISIVAYPKVVITLCPQPF